MERPLRILNLEDDPKDTELIQERLKEEGLACELVRIETERDFVSAVEQGGYDLLLVDYKLPGFDGMTALTIAKEKCPDIPFVFVSGSIEEGMAIEALKNGATDYVLKDKLSRLAPAVRRALKEVAERRERKRVTEALQTSEEQLKTYFESAGDAIYILEAATGRIRDCNTRACLDLGYSKDELLKLSAADIKVSLVTEEIAAVHLQTKPGTVTTIEGIHKRKDGTVYPVEIRLSTLAPFQSALMISIVRDITKRKLTEERLKLLNECFLKFGPDPLENINRLVSLCGKLMEGTCALYNRLEDERLCSWGLWNVPPDYNTVDAPEGHICFDVINGASDEVVVIRNLPETAYVKTDPNVSRYNLLTYVGIAVKFFDVYVGSLCVVYQKDFLPSADDKNILGLIASAIGVEEERKQSEEALQKSEAFIKGILESIDEGLIVIDRDYRIISANRAFTEQTGMALADMTGKHCFEIFYRRTAPCYEEEETCAVKQVFDTGEPHTVTNRNYDSKGASAYFETKAYPLTKDASGKVMTVVEVLVDITERITAEEALLAATREWAESFDAMTDGVSIQSPDHKIMNVNQSLCDLFGKTPEELIGKKCYQVFHGKDCPISDCPFQKTKVTNQRTSVEIFEPAINKWLLVSTSPVFDDAGSLTRIVHTVRDVTERRQAEEELKKLTHKISLILNSAGEGIYGLDLDGKVTFINPAGGQDAGI